MRRRLPGAACIAIALILLAGCSAHTTIAATPAVTSSPTKAPVLPTLTTASPTPKPLPTKATGVQPGTQLTAFYAQRASWRACTRAFAAPDFLDLRGLQCATIAVPLDYTHPAGRRITIGIARLKATGRSRIGSLVINPGGPGVSGLTYLADARGVIPAAVRARFDIVGFDPRGVGVSAGLHCLTTAGFDALVAASVPRSPAQVAGVVALDHSLAAGCKRAAGWELPYLGTVYSARDLDLVRSAIGDARLSYLGKSYGTLLGAVYADEFPARVRALVLDGALPPGLGEAAQAQQQGQGFEGELRDFLADCLRHADCPYGGSQPRAQLDALLARVAARPLPTGLGRLLHGGEAVSGLSAALYSTSTWPVLRTALTRAGRGDGSLLLELSDALGGRHGNAYDTQAGAFPAISCADDPLQTSAPQAAALARSWARTAPLYGPLEAWGLLTCDGWVASRTALPDRVTARGAAPIVVVGSTGDPATPYAWARDLAGQLAGARLVTFEGDGHTVYGDGRSSCVDRAVNAYLVDLAVPAAGLTCR